LVALFSSKGLSLTGGVEERKGKERKGKERKGKERKGKALALLREGAVVLALALAGRPCP
jgi:predicted aconitase with swiveling domain